ncbi:hypothetical protein ACQY1Q_11620 [Tenacibaculum sp. TC6]
MILKKLINNSSTKSTLSKEDNYLDSNIPQHIIDDILTSLKELDTMKKK